MNTNLFKTFVYPSKPNIDTWDSISETLEKVVQEHQEFKYKNGINMSLFKVDDSFSSNTKSLGYFSTLQEVDGKLQTVWFTREQSVENVKLSVVLPDSNSAISIVADIKFLPDRYQFELSVHSIEDSYKVHYWNPFKDICLVFKPDQKGCFLSSKNSIDLGINFLNYFYSGWKEEDYFTYSFGLRDTGYLHRYKNKKVYSCQYILRENIKEGLLYFNKSFGVGGELLNFLPKSLEKDIECYRYNNPNNFDCLFTSNQKQIDFKTLEETQTIDDESWCYKFTY